MNKISTQDELLKNAQFHPVFNENGEIVDITQLTVATDRRLGIRAMEELVEENRPGDDAVTSEGWTVKQARLLDKKAPHAAHYLKSSQKYDAATGEMVPSTTILLHFEVVWRLFEQMFEGQFSIEVGNVETLSEDILPTSNGDKDAKDDAPGRIFYSRAEVTIVLHLKNGATRRYTGVGVAYDHVRINKTGNVFAINSARRTTEKGAVSDAKREAISNIGRVFRRAFEDGDSMKDKFHDMLMEKIRKENKDEKPTRATGSETVPAPASRKPKAEKKAEPKPAASPKAEQAPSPTAEATSKPAPKQEQAKDDIPFDQFEEKTNVNSEGVPKETASEKFTVVIEGKAGGETDDPDLYFDRIADALSEIDDLGAVGAILEENADDLRRAEKNSAQGNSYSALRDMVFESLEEPTEEPVEEAPKEETPEKDVDSNPAGDWTITVQKKTGVAILDGYKAAFKKAKSPKDVDAILEANTELAKRLTKAQKGKFLAAVAEAKTSFK